MKCKYLTNHWREIFDPTAQIFLNSTVMSQTESTQLIVSFFQKSKAFQE